MEKILRITLLSLALGIHSQPSLAQPISRMPTIIDTTQFKLLTTQTNFLLYQTSDRSKKQISIPRAWLIPLEDEKEEEEFGGYVSSFNYDEKVTSFNVGDGRTGIHASSYEIQKEGSAQAAAGRDVFLVYDQKSNTIHNGKIDLGITKGRVRSMGCFFASHSRFLLSDINYDGFLDIGVIKEELRCIEVQKDDVDSIEGPFYEQHPIRWYVFKGNQWEYDRSLDRRFPRDRYWELPLIGIVKSPVDFVKDFFKEKG